MSLPGGLFLLRVLGGRFLGTPAFLSFAPGLLSASVCILLLRLYDCIRFFYQPLRTLAILLPACLISLRVLSSYLLLTGLSLAGFLCAAAGLFLCALTLLLCCPTTFHIKGHLAYVA